MTAKARSNTNAKPGEKYCTNHQGHGPVEGSRHKPVEGGLRKRFICGTCCAERDRRNKEKEAA